MDKSLDYRTVNAQPAHPLPAAVNDPPKEGKVASLPAPTGVPGNTNDRRQKGYPGKERGSAVHLLFRTELNGQNHCRVQQAAETDLGSYAVEPFNQEFSTKPSIP